MLNQGWKLISGIAFNHSNLHQTMAKIVDATDEKPLSENKAVIEQKNRAAIHQMGH